MKAQLADRKIAAVDEKKRIPFKMYDRGEYLDLVALAALKLRPGSMGHGMYDIGAGVYPALRNSLVGKSIFSIADYDFKRAMSLAPRGFAVSNVFGKVSLERLDAHSAHVVMEDVWNPTHLSVGIFLGGMEIFKATPVSCEFLEHRPGHIELKLEWEEVGVSATKELRRDMRVRT